MGDESTKDNIEELATGISILDKILGGGLRFHKKVGLFGIIVGAAGTGKSTFGMQLCSRFLLSEIARRPKMGSVSLSRKAVYLSQESPDLIAEKIIGSFDFFKTDDERNPSGPQREKPNYEIDTNDIDRALKADVPALIVRQLDFDETTQARRLRNIFDILGRTRDAIEGANQNSWDRLLICVDNIDSIHDQALMKAVAAPNSDWEDAADGSRNAGIGGPPAETESQWQRRSGRNFFMHLRRDCAKRRINSYFIFEERPPEGRDPDLADITTTPEVFAADVAIRLGTHVRGAAYRERYLEVVKAKNQFYHRGKHHCTVVSSTNSSSATRGERGIVVYPSVATQLSWLKKMRDEQKGPAEEEGGPVPATADRRKPRYEYSLGVDSLDCEIARSIGVKDDKQYRFISPGTCNVLVSDLDIKATAVALHFARQPGPPPGPQPSLFISFLHEENHLEEIARRFPMWRKGERSKLPEFEFFPPGHVSEGQLLYEIRLLIEKAQEKTDSSAPVLVVVDNVFELKSRYPLLTSEMQFLTALIELFRVRKATCLFVDAVKAGETRNPIESSIAASLADNVFLLRHVDFQSRTHHVFSVVKLLYGGTPELLWDLDERKAAENEMQLRALDTFEFYKNVLSGRPEPVTIRLTLYHDGEDSPLDRFIRGQQKALQESFGARIDVKQYGPDEYARVQSNLASAEERERMDCQVVALDEFWIEKLIAKGALVELGDPIKELEKEHEFARADYVSAAHDLALYKLRHDTGRHAPQSLRPVVSGGWYAIPARNNCGVLCCNPRVIHKLLTVMEGEEKGDAGQEEMASHKERDESPQEVRERLAKWLNRDPDANFTWQDLKLFEKDSLLYRAHFEETWVLNARFFTFCMDQLESCVSCFLEFLLSYTKRGKRNGKNEWLDDAGRLKIEKFPVDAVKAMFGLLDRHDVSLLAAGTFRPSRQEMPALFTRQWMSTLGCLRSRNPPYDSNFQEYEPFELPRGSDETAPKPVSGTWYLGILKGSVSVKAGVRVINEFTSVSDELYQLNNYIGLPVRSLFYRDDDTAAETSLRGDTKPGAPFPLPYKDRFRELAEIQRPLVSHLNGSDNDCRGDDRERYEAAILRSDYPFYRMQIDDYPHVAPILWRLLVRLAKGVQRKTHGSIEAKDPELDSPHFEEHAERALSAAALEYDILLSRRLASDS